MPLPVVLDRGIFMGFLTFVISDSELHKINYQLDQKSNKKIVKFVIFQDKKFGEIRYYI
jgi:hypothetical protein